MSLRNIKNTMYNVKNVTNLMLVLATKCGGGICVCRHFLYFALCVRVCFYFMKGSVHTRFLRKLVFTLKCNFLKKINQV